MIIRLLVISAIVTLSTSTHGESTAGLVASYNFSAGLLDSGPNGYHAEGQGAFVASETLQFPNDNFSFVTLPSAVFNGLTDFTIYCKFFLNEINSDLNLILSGANASALNYFIIYYIPWEGKWGFSYQNINYTFEATVPAPNQWYCLMLTRKGNTFSLYIDGDKAINDLVINGDPLQVEKMILGQEQDCLGGCFDWNQNLNGMVDNFSVFNRALGTDEISSGCVDPADNQPTVPPDVENLPNVVTPNNDGFNDKLEFFLTDPADIHYLSIFNRWGERIYYSWNYSNDWDGSSVESGVYYYSFDYDGGKYRGWVTVIR